MKEYKNINRLVCYTESLSLPTDLLFLRIALPELVFDRALKPCLLILFLFVRVILSSLAMVIFYSIRVDSVFLE